MIARYWDRETGELREVGHNGYPELRIPTPPEPCVHFGICYKCQPGFIRVYERGLEYGPDRFDYYLKRIEQMP